MANYSVSVILRLYLYFNERIIRNYHNFLGGGMIKGFLTAGAVFALSLFVLSLSLFKSVSVDYVFSKSSDEVNFESAGDIQVDYDFPEQGFFLPDDKLWPLEAMWDKFSLMLNSDPVKEIDLLVYMSDKRLIYAQSLVKKGNLDCAAETIAKAESYLNAASEQEKVYRRQGINTSEQLASIADSASAHKDMIEQLMNLFPHEGKVQLTKLLASPTIVYNEAMTGLISFDNQLSTELLSN